MIANIKLFFAAAALALLAACSSDTSTNTVSTTKNAEIGSPAEPLQMAVDAYTPPASVGNTKADSMVARSMLTQVTAKVIDLGAPAASMSDNATNDGMLGKPLQVSFGRDIVQTMNTTATQQLLNWKTSLTGNQVAAISITSATAKALRIGLQVTKLPETAKLRFYTQNTQSAHEVTGKDVLNLIAENIAAGDKTDAGRTYWSPVMTGSEGTIEIEIPNGTSTNDVAIALPQISHFFKTLAEAAEQATTNNQSLAGLSCQVDVTCSALPVASNSVVNVYFTDALGDSYGCSGTLLNNSANNGIPYVYTANHCIADQTTASTVLTVWFYRSTSCNSASYNYSIVYGGSALRYTAVNTDATLIQLNNAAPAGALFAGWDASMQSLNSEFTNIGHPRGDPQRKSTGLLTGYFGDIKFSGGNFTVVESTQQKSQFYRITMNKGLNEPGSSGGGLFKNITSTNPQVVGSLTGGQAGSCSSTTASNPQTTYYGRFDYAFAAGMSAWLSPARRPVYRFFNATLGTHFFTMNGGERNNIIANLPEYAYEGVSFTAYPSQVSNNSLSPVYRFFNTKTRAHFYTISLGERNQVITTLPEYTYEGISWYARTSADTETTPLYRFFRTTSRTHFYTTSPSEKDFIITNYPFYNYENISYHVWPKL